MLYAQSCPTLCDSLHCSLPGSLSLGFYRQEYWSGLPFPTLGDLPDSGIKPTSLALQVDSLPLSSGESPLRGYVYGMLLILSLSSSWTIRGSLTSLILSPNLLLPYILVLYVLCCAYLLSHIQLFVTPCTVAHQGPLSMGILQARILEWVAFLFFRVSSQPRDRTQVSCIGSRFFTN